VLENYYRKAKDFVFVRILGKTVQKLGCCSYTLGRFSRNVQDATDFRKNYNS
jgi:hypothetical protein